MSASLAQPDHKDSPVASFKLMEPLDLPVHLDLRDLSDPREYLESVASTNLANKDRLVTLAVLVQLELLDPTDHPAHRDHSVRIPKTKVDDDSILNVHRFQEKKARVTTVLSHVRHLATKSTERRQPLRSYTVLPTVLS